MKKILYTITSMGAKSGGTSSAVYSFIQGISNYDVEILTFEIEKGDKLPENIQNIIFIKQPKRKRFAYSPLLKKAITENNSKLYHIHGIWQYVEYITSRIARKRNIPYIISPHGMLYPQAFEKNKWIKKMFFSLFLKKDLQKATCIHVTCSEEMFHIRELGITAPIAIIPNPVEIPLIVERIIPAQKRFGYLGRLHSRKNIERLIYAWNIIEKHGDEELVIIGDGDELYLSFLKQEIERLNLKNVVFTGFLSGEEKNKVLDSLTCLVVPSDFENFGMIVAEALSRKIPVIASKGTPWEDLSNYECGWWINNDIETISKTISEVLLSSDDVLQKMGDNGYSLILNKYSVPIVGENLTQLYKWIIDGGEKPECVYLKEKTLC